VFLVDVEEFNDVVEFDKESNVRGEGIEGAAAA